MTTGLACLWIAWLTTTTPTPEPLPAATATHAEEPKPAAPTAATAAAPIEDATESDSPTRAVVVLPFQAGRGVTAQQAQGVAARVRRTMAALGDEGSLSLLPSTKADDKAVRRCAQEAACYADIAAARGADVVVYGLVESGAGALRVVAKASGRGTVEHTFAFRADDDATNSALDRVARELAAPETLRGSLKLTGQPGDSVVVDGQRRGTIETDGTFVLEHLREGRHALEVRRTEGNNGEFYEPFVRTVTITHRQETALKVVLLRADPATAPSTSADGPSVISIAAMAAGGALVLGGVGAGVWSLVDAANVAERAQAQQLFFPRDEGLVSRGRTLAVVANALWGAGVIVGCAGGAWWALGGSHDDDAPAAASSPETTPTSTPTEVMP